MRKGALEKQIAEGVISFWRELLGRGPEDAPTFILQDMVIVRMKGVLTTEERVDAYERRKPRLHHFTSGTNGVFLCLTDQRTSG